MQREHWGSSSFERPPLPKDERLSLEQGSKKLRADLVARMEKANQAGKLEEVARLGKRLKELDESRGALWEDQEAA